MTALLTLNAVYFLFGATIYCGVMWALKFFFYPSWQGMSVNTVQTHFIIPTDAATRFFLVIVPVMHVSAIIMVVGDWGHPQAMAAAAIALLCIIASTLVGWFLIIPINRRIKAGVADDATLEPMLLNWMRLNTIRWVTVTIMWAATVWYFLTSTRIG